MWIFGFTGERVRELTPLDTLDVRCWDHIGSGDGKGLNVIEIHRGIGEGLFLVYVIVMAVVFFMGRRGKKAPAAAAGIAHGLLAIQVAIGVIMLLEEPDRVVWYHPVIGLAAILALGLTPMLKARMGATRGLVAGLGIVGLLTLVAMLVVRT